MVDDLELGALGPRVGDDLDRLIAATVAQGVVEYVD